MPSNRRFALHKAEQHYLFVTIEEDGHLKDLTCILRRIFITVTIAL